MRDRYERTPWKPSKVLPGVAYRETRLWMAISDPIESGFIVVDRQRHWVGFSTWREWKAARARG